MLNYPELIEAVSERFGCDWDAGTRQNQELSKKLTALMDLMPDFPRESKAEILLEFICVSMHLDPDDEGEEAIRQIIMESL